ncbi:hypothetical protein [Ruegeria sp. 6PALISEP08]|uniref:hypothetical protein n=1 Tax=Ruegeria sp. 6PALISEP08 TaxID=1225660 RepID=UPI0009F819E4|nr:hypothetical protein [Ruegeria sp. 6PALISEP08]
MRNRHFCPGHPDRAFYGLVFVGAFTAVVTIVLVKVVALLILRRVDAKTETNRRDLSTQGERV